MLLVDAAVIVSFFEVADDELLEVFSVALVGVELAQPFDDGVLVLEHELLEVLVVSGHFKRNSRKSLESNENQENYRQCEF